MPGNPDEGIEPYLGVRPLAEEYQRPNDLPAHVAMAIDAVTRSGSGLDPHISPDNALLQVRRIAHVRDLNEAQATLTLLLAGRFAAQGRKPAMIGTLPCDTHVRRAHPWRGAPPRRIEFPARSGAWADGGASATADRVVSGRQLGYNSCNRDSRPRNGASTMKQTVNVNPTCEHGVYLRLFVTNGGGW